MIFCLKLGELADPEKCHTERRSCRGCEHAERLRESRPVGERGGA